jgi:ABC-type spermidine/putrescine transport system permease subunit I
LAVPLTALVVLFVAPLSFMAVYSFWAIDNSYQLQRTFQLTQYEQVFTTGPYLAMLGRSAWLAALTTLASLAIALPLAYAIARLVPPRYRVLLLIALIIPGWVSVLIRTYAWTLVIGESGLLNYLLIHAGLIEKPLQILFTKTAVVMGLVYIYLPYMLVPIYAALERLDPALLEAAENLGAGPVERFVKVTLPLIAPGIVAGSIITFIPAAGEYLVPNLLGGLSGTMYGNLITAAFENFNWPLGSALSMTLLASLLITLAVMGRFVDVKRLFSGAS